MNDTVAVKQAVKWSHFKTWNRLRRSAPLSFQNGIKFLHRQSNAKQNLEIQVFCYLRSKSVEILEQNTGIPQFTLLMWGHKIKTAQAKTA